MPDVTVQIHNHTCRIILDRSAKKNALTHAMYLQMAEALESVADNELIKCVLIESRGDFFCAGNDLHDFVASKDNDKLAENVRFMHALMNCKLPVVAKVQGDAVGIGVTMLLHCDLVYAAPDASFVMPFVDLALVPEFASSYLLPQLAGHRKASKWLMNSEPFNAEEADQFGLVSEIVALPQLSEKVEQVISGLENKPRMALAHTKALMKTDQDEILLHMNDELDIFIDQLNSEAAQEAFSAILEKRKPDPNKYN